MFLVQKKMAVRKASLLSGHQSKQIRVGGQTEMEATLLTAPFFTIFNLAYTGGPYSLRNKMQASFLIFKHFNHTSAVFFSGTTKFFPSSTKFY